MLSQQKVAEHYTALKSNTLQVPCIKTMHANTMHQKLHLTHDKLI